MPAIIILSVLFLVLSIFSSVLASYYNENYIHETKQGLIEVITKKKQTTLFYFFVYILFSVVCVFFYSRKHLPTVDLLQAAILWYIVLAIAVVDLKIKKIPNSAVLLALIIRIVFIFINAIVSPTDFKYIAFQSILGMVVGGFIILACLLISRGGVGAGDFKLFAILGLYYGLSGIIQIMMYSLFFAAIYSVVMLISRKAKLKSTMAMAPFILCGLSVFLFFSAVME